MDLDPPPTRTPQHLDHLEGAPFGTAVENFTSPLQSFIDLKACFFETEIRASFITIHLHYSLSVPFLLSTFLQNTINYIQIAIMEETLLSFLIHKADRWALKPRGSSICCSSRIPSRAEDEINRRGAVCSSTFVQVWHMHTSLATIFEEQDQGGEEESGSD